MDSLIESCDKRVNEILCGLKQPRHTRTRQDKWIFFRFSNIFLDRTQGGASKIHF